MDATEKLPTSSQCAVRELIDRHGVMQPDRVFARFASGRPDWTWGQVREDVRATAGMLRALGVGQGDHVAMWLPNGPEALKAWFAVNYLGAVIVPINQAYRGRLLEHAIALSDARILFVHADLLDRLADVDPARLEVLLVQGGAAPPRSGLKVLDPETAPRTQDLALEREVAPWDTQSIIFTSGTTGPSKGVIVTYAQMYFSGVHQRVPISSEDRSLLHAPLFHVAGMGAVFRALVVGGSVGVLERFNTGTFWRDVRRVGATRATMMGSMAAFLLGQPVTEDERLTPLKTLIVAPVSPDTVALAKRIGATWFTTFNMTETSFPILSELNPEKVGICGRPRAGIEARVVDAHDVELPRGQLGELVLRSDTPWALTSGYHKNPEATARAWRNGWFHPGDGFRVDDDGDFIFVDRLKDAIRRRGENISSYEVEVEVGAHPDVEDCAAVGVPSEHGEDEVLVVVEAVAGRRVVAADLLAFLQPRMAHFMLPRFIRVVEALPRTPTHKIQKHILRAEGVTPDTWDREAAGIRITRDKIGAERA
jgi:crotonobetaine/carnitine-CoA ligase